MIILAAVDGHEEICATFHQLKSEREREREGEKKKKKKYTHTHTHQIRHLDE